MRVRAALTVVLALAACGDRGRSATVPGSHATPPAADESAAPGEERPAAPDRRHADTRGRLDLTGVPENVLVEYDGEPLRGVVLFDPGAMTVYLHVDGELIESRVVMIRAGETTTIDTDSLLAAATARREKLGLPSGCGPVRNVDLAWFVAHRSADGSWDAAHVADRSGHDPPCDGAVAKVSSVESTALVLLAFLANGETHETGPYRAAVRAGMDWLVAGQTDDGVLAPGATEETRVHAMATCALTELVGATGSAHFARSAQAAVDRLLARRRPVDGWSTRAEFGPLDVSATAWAVLAVDSARRAGLSLPDGAARRLADDVAATGTPDADRRDLATTALVTLAALVVGRPPDDPGVVRGVAQVLAHPPTADTDPRVLWAGSAVVLRAAGAAAWTRWDAALCDAVMPSDAAGAAEPGAASERPGATAASLGRLRGAAYVLLARAIHYRHDRVLGVTSD